jgi:hypothetical protein
MNKDTGQIREIVPPDGPTDREVPLHRSPRSNCKKCYGRGYEGRRVNRDGSLGDFIPCACTSEPTPRTKGRIQEKATQGNPDLEKKFAQNRGDSPGKFCGGR